MTLLARVVVMPKSVVNDPQGATVQQGLGSLGFDEVAEVRIGKYIEMTLRDGSEEHARQRVDEMCHKLLANRVIEDFSYDVVDVSSPNPTPTHDGGGGRGGGGRP
jgi:phosphoribosylformylglycinamidine synthase